MRTKLLMLIPVFALISGCTEKIEAQENALPTVETSSDNDLPPEEDQPAADDADLKLQSPVGID